MCRENCRTCGYQNVMWWYSVKSAPAVLQGSGQVQNLPDEAPCQEDAQLIWLHIHTRADIFSDSVMNLNYKTWQQLFSPKPSITVPIRSDIYCWVRFNSYKIILLQNPSAQDTVLRSVLLRSYKSLPESILKASFYTWPLPWIIWTPSSYKSDHLQFHYIWAKNCWWVGPWFNSRIFPALSLSTVLSK